MASYTYSASDRNATPTATPTATPARPLRPNLAEAMTWTPRPVEEPRPTASGYEPPHQVDIEENDAYGRAYHEGLCAGLARIRSTPPEGYTNAERRAFVAGYETGWADDTDTDFEADGEIEAARLEATEFDWDEYRVNFNRIDGDSMTDTIDLEAAETEARGAWGGGRDY